MPTPPTNWTPTAIEPTAWETIAVNPTAWNPGEPPTPPTAFLLLQTGDFLLQQDGGLIGLQQA